MYAPNKPLQVAPVTEPGHMVPMPRLADQLNVGNGCLVQWSLQDSGRDGLGFVLMIEEVMDRAEKLKQTLSQHGDFTVVEHIVHTLAACTRLLARYVDSQLFSTLHWKSQNNLVS